MLVDAILSKIMFWVCGCCFFVVLLLFFEEKHIFICPSKVGFLQTKATGCHEYIKYKKVSKSQVNKINYSLQTETNQKGLDH